MQRARRARGALLRRGFTLVELLVVIVIISFLVAMAMPNFRQYVAAQSIRAQVSDLMGALRLARTEAIKRGRVVTVCRVADPNLDPPSCAAGDDWSSGWMLMAGTQVIRVQQGYQDSGGIQARGIANVQFLPNGLAIGATGSFEFRPKLDPSASGYESLIRRLCLSASGASRPC